MTRRVLLIELQAQTQGARTYATWNPSDKTGNCTLSGGNLVATAAATASYNGARGTIAMTAGAWYWETTHTFASGSGYVLAAGIATEDFVFSTTQLGTDVAKLSAGGPGQDGQCRYNNAVAGDAGTVATTNVVRHWLDLDAGTYKVAIMGGSFVTVASDLNTTPDTNGRRWYPVCQFTTNAHVITANFGATAFTYSVPDGAASGISSIAANTDSTVYLASEFVLSDGGGTPANTLYEGRLLASSVPSMRREASCWVWGGEEAKITFGELEFANADGGLDYLLTLVVRDRPVVMRYGTPFEAFVDPSACEDYATAIADRVEATESGTIRLVLIDKLAQADKKLTNATYPSWVQETSLADNPKPVLLGKGWSLDPPLVEPTLYYFDLHDGGLFAIDEVFDMADIDLLNTDYFVRNTGFDKVPVPVGKTTATARGAFKAGTSLFTENFTSWSAGAHDNNPTSWTVTGESSAAERIYERTSGRCAFKKSGGGSSLYMERNVGFVAGTAYVVEVNCTYFASGSALLFYTSNGAGTTYVQSLAIDTTRRDGVHKFIVVPNSGQTHLRILMGASATGEVELESITIHTASLIERLPDWLTELLVTRGGLVSGDLDSTSISALDTAAPYTLGFFARSGAVLIREVIRQTMRSFTGWLVPDRTGKLTVGRLTAPSGTAVLSFTEADLAAVPTSRMDRAENLTNQIGAQRNWSMLSDADFAGSVSAADKAKLKRQFREVRRAAATLDASYAHAETLSPHETLLQSGTHAQAEINRVCSLYRVPRRFYEFALFIDLADALALVPGQTINATMPWFDLGTGKNLIVTAIDLRWNSSVVRLTCWG